MSPPTFNAELCICVSFDILLNKIDVKAGHQEQHQSQKNDDHGVKHHPQNLNVLKVDRIQT